MLFFYIHFRVKFICACVRRVNSSLLKYFIRFFCSRRHRCLTSSFSFFSFVFLLLVVFPLTMHVLAGIGLGMFCDRCDIFHVHFNPYRHESSVSSSCAFFCVCFLCTHRYGRKKWLLVVFVLSFLGTVFFSLFPIAIYLSLNEWLNAILERFRRLKWCVFLSISGALVVVHSFVLIQQIKLNEKGKHISRHFYSFRLSARAASSRYFDLAWKQVSRTEKQRTISSTEWKKCNCNCLKRISKWFREVSFAMRNKTMRNKQVKRQQFVIQTQSSVCILLSFVELHEKSACMFVSFAMKTFFYLYFERK